jgi:exodeoxyribonuclease-3
MRIATWNVNSVKARLETVLAWFKEAAPDVVCLQEIKCEDSAFPRTPFEELGYNLAIHGQKTYNGVAILSKSLLEDVTPWLPGCVVDDHARYLDAVIAGKRDTLRVASIYLPNGNPPNTDKYAYKLAWMDRLIARSRALLALEQPFVLAGDFNVIPAPVDAKQPEAWTTDALFLPKTRAQYRRLLALGLTDAVRAASSAPGIYTFWDYQAGSWQKNNGIRIDHCLLSPQAADRFVSARIDKHVRGWEKPSDHVPLVIELDI